MNTGEKEEVSRGLQLLTEVLKVARSSTCWWRGQSKHWPLQPKANRDPWLSHDPARAYGEWSRLACRHTSLPASLLDALALAQHHGLATPLLDWTSNPLVALYFAASERTHKKEDGAVYTVYPPPMDVMAEEPRIARVGGSRISTGDLRDDYSWFGYIPRVTHSRIDRQSGLFTYHPWGSPAVTAQGTIIVPAELKTDVLYTLTIMGVNESTVFPDLVGLSGYINDSILTLPLEVPPTRS